MTARWVEAVGVLASAARARLNNAPVSASCSLAKQHGSEEFVIPYDRQTLAGYLGVERSAMSAELGKLKKAGLIDCTGSRFRILMSER